MSTHVQPHPDWKCLENFSVTRGDGFPPVLPSLVCASVTQSQESGRIKTLTCAVKGAQTGFRCCSNLQGKGRAGAYLVCPGAPLEGHFPHVFAVIFRNTTRLNQGRHQVIFDGLEL